VSICGRTGGKIRLWGSKEIQHYVHAYAHKQRFFNYINVEEGVNFLDNLIYLVEERKTFNKKLGPFNFLCPFWDVRPNFQPIGIAY
jgi:hypothetical protein